MIKAINQFSIMTQKPNESRLEASSWFENKVSQREFEEFKAEVFEKLRNNSLNRMYNTEAVNRIEERMDRIERLIDPPELTESPYSSENEDGEEIEDEGEDEEENEETGSSSTSDSGDSESDSDDQESYYRRRWNNNDDQF